MPKKLCFVVLGAALASASLTSCCFDCISNTDDNFLFFAFSADSLGGTGFRRAELRSVYAVIYSSPGFQGLRDTLRQLPPNTSTTANSLVLYPSATPSGMMTFHMHAQPDHPLSYRVFVPTASRVYNIDNVAHALIENKCKCRTVTEKQFTVDGQLQVVPARGPAVVLSR